MRGSEGASEPNSIEAPKQFKFKQICEINSSNIKIANNLSETRRSLSYCPKSPHLRYFIQDVNQN